MRRLGRSTFCRFVLVSVWVSVAVPGTRSELATTSPFLPPKGQIVAAPLTPPPLELRGIAAVENTTIFSIFDPSKKASAWVGLNEQGPGFSVSKYHPEMDSVTVEYQDRTLILALRNPKVAVAASTERPMIRPAVGSAARTLVPRPTAPNPSPADLAAEILRLRELRNQTGPTATPARQNTAPGVVPPPSEPGNSPVIRRR